MNKLDNFKKQYGEIPIPKELDEMINKTIENDMKNKNKKKKKYNTLVASAASLALLILPLNLIPSFANELYEIPILGSIARVLSVDTYISKTENIEIVVNMPAVEDLSDKEYQSKVNSIIKAKVDKSLSEAKVRVDEYKEAYIETGGSQEGFKEKNMQVKVDYKVFSNTDNVISFLVYSHESLAAAYAEYNYYNIDVKNNKSITLEDLLGDNYQEIITNSVLKDVKLQKSSGIISFFDDVDSEDFMIPKDIDFYINGENNIVIVFDKYEIAPGSFGRIEYTIKI